MVSSSRSRRRRWTALAWLVTALLGTTVSGCSVGETDLARWETTLGGPKRLSAVVLFDKYPMEIRVKAAMSLVNMKPRKGRHVGVQRLVKGTLVCDPEYLDPGEPCMKRSLNPEERAEIIGRMVPIILEGLKQEAPKPTQGEKVPPDPSVKFKDAAYLMLTYEKTQVITDQGLRKQLEDALTAWAMADFERRLNDKSQAFGMEQLLRHIGPSSVKQLPSKMVKNSRSLQQMADLVSKIGSKETKEEASKQLVKIAEYVGSQEWKKEKTPQLEEANRNAGYKLSKEQFNEQLTAYQGESLTRVFGSMKKVGGDAVVTWALEAAKNNKKPEDVPEDDWVKRRALGVAAITGHVDRKNKKHVSALLDIVKNKDIAPEIVDQAFARLRELPRDAVIEDLYGLFDTKDWQRRRLAGVTILKISKAKHIEEFLGKLKEKPAKNFDPNEAITYGAYLAELKEGEPLKLLEPYMKKGDAKQRITALAYWRAVGNKTMLDKIKPYTADKQRAPACEPKEDEAFDCEWKCIDGKETKKVTTVGEFVSYCVKPVMEKREPKKKDGSKNEDPKDDKKE